LPETIDTTPVESDDAETVKLSVLERSVVFPAESLGVIVIVADSPLAKEAEVEESEKDAGAPAIVQTTVAD
jgi:hypothetical protein